MTTRPQPTPLSGCTCGGVGDTGAHRPPCPWALKAARFAAMDDDQPFASDEEARDYLAWLMTGGN